MVDSHKQLHSVKCIYLKSITKRSLLLTSCKQHKKYQTIFHGGFNAVCQEHHNAVMLVLEINFCEGLQHSVYSNIHTDEELYSETKAIVGNNNVKMSALRLQCFI